MHAYLKTQVADVVPDDLSGEPTPEEIKTVNRYLVRRRLVARLPLPDVPDNLDEMKRLIEELEAELERLENIVGDGIDVEKTSAGTGLTPVEG